MKSSWELVQEEEDRETKKLIRKEILDMEPGRKLDSMVAKKVMGWKFHNGNIPCWYPPNLLPEQNIYGHEFPEYSLNISAAWEVVDKMQKEGWAFFVKGDTDGNYANFTKSNIHYLEKGDTAPHAICLAALLALMEVEK